MSAKEMAYYSNYEAALSKLTEFKQLYDGSEIHRAGIVFHAVPFAVADSEFDVTVPLARDWPPGTVYQANRDIYRRAHT